MDKTTFSNEIQLLGFVYCFQKDEGFIEKFCPLKYFFISWFPVKSGEMIFLTPFN